METLHRETVDLGGGIVAELGRDYATVKVPGVVGTREVTMVPKSRQDANRMSIALKKAARRLQDIGAKLPDEPAT